MKNHPPLHAEKRFIKNQGSAISEERLAFLDGERLGDLSIGIEDNATCRKIRRIIEKRITQNFWHTASFILLSFRFMTRKSRTNARISRNFRKK